MLWIELVTLLSIVQYVWFSVAAGRARGRYGVEAPATTGNTFFERYYRVQMNTLETLIVFLPLLWMATRYWGPFWPAGLGAVYLIGRTIYYFAYIKAPSSRTLGYGLTVAPVLVLMVGVLWGIIVGLIASV